MLSGLGLWVKQRRNYSGTILPSPPVPGWLPRTECGGAGTLTVPLFWLEGIPKSGGVGGQAEWGCELNFPL